MRRIGYIAGAQGSEFRGCEMVKLGVKLYEFLSVFGLGYLIDVGVDSVAFPPTEEFDVIF